MFDLRKIRDYIFLNPKFDADSKSVFHLLLRSTYCSVKFRDSKLTCSTSSYTKIDFFLNFIFDIKKIRDHIPLDPRFDADSKSVVRLFRRIFVLL